MWHFTRISLTIFHSYIYEYKLLVTLDQNFSLKVWRSRIYFLTNINIRQINIYKYTYEYIYINIRIFEIYKYIKYKNIWNCSLYSIRIFIKVWRSWIYICYKYINIHRNIYKFVKWIYIYIGIWVFDASFLNTRRVADSLNFNRIMFRDVAFSSMFVRWLFGCERW